jgi:hypothetical protein
MSNTENWHKHFGSAVESDRTVECVQCGSSMLGDDPVQQVICTECFDHSGIILRDRVICMECSCDELQGGVLVTSDTHPDGFTCADCGNVFSS